MIVGGDRKYFISAINVDAECYYLEECYDNSHNADNV